MTTNDVSDTRISAEHAQALADRDWWQEAGDIIGLELRGWTYRSGATFVDRDTGRNVELPGSVAKRILASRHPQPVNEPGEWQVEAEKTFADFRSIRKNLALHGVGAWDAERDAFFEALLAASIPKEPAPWVEGIESAPWASTVLAGYWSEEHGEWIVRLFVAERPTAPFTHWQYVMRPGEALSPSTSEGEAVAMDRAMRGGEDCGWPDCGCCHDAKCSDAPQPTPVAPVPVTITQEWLRDTAMNIMLATEVEEAMRVLSAALSAKPTGEE